MHALFVIEVIWVLAQITKIIITTAQKH